jgi:O-antigen/teichoic acid export membrane protein
MSERSNLSALLSSSLLIFAGVMLTSVATLLERVLVARYYSLEAYGEVSIGLALLTMASSISLIGLNHGVPRYISRFDDPREVRGVWLTGLVVAGLVALVFAGIIYTQVELVARYLFEDPDAPALVRLFVFAIPLVVVMRIAISAIRGLENTRYKVLVYDLLYPGVRLAVLGGLILAGMTVLSVGYAYVVAALVALVAAHVLFGRLFSLVGSFTLFPRTLMRFSLPLVGSSILAVLLSRMDTLMLGFFRPSAEVGLYNAAMPLASSLVIVLSSIGYLYLPLTSRLDADGKREEVQSIYRLTTRWGFILTFPAFVLFTVYAGDLLALTFGPQSRPAAPAMIVIALGVFTNVALGRNRETLSALGDTDRILLADGSAFGLNFVLNLVLIPPFGMMGAAVASAISVVAKNAVIYAALRLGFGITPFSRELVTTYVLVPTFVLPPFLVAAALTTTSPLAIPFIGVAAALATLVVVFATGLLEPEDVVAVELIEDLVGVRLGFVRRYIPDAPA